MSEIRPTEMKQHEAIEYSGGDRGVMIQIQHKAPNPAALLDAIRLDLAEAVALRNTLSGYIRDEALRRQRLLKEELEAMNLTEKTVFHEVAAIESSSLTVPDLAVSFIDKFCPKVRREA